MDFQDIKGQEHVKRVLEVAAAGAHNVIMSGSPGSGKTLMARVARNAHRAAQLRRSQDLCGKPQSLFVPLSLERL